jgi:hypothetical protein
MTGIVVPCRSDETVLVSEVGLFPCTALGATSNAIPAGTYTVNVHLLDSSLQVVAMDSIPNVVVTDGNVTNIGASMYVPNAIGNVHFTWEVQSTGTPGCYPGESTAFQFDSYQEQEELCGNQDVTLNNVRTGSYSVGTSLRSGFTIDLAGPTIPLAVAPYTTNEGGHIVFQR